LADPHIGAVIVEMTRRSLGGPVFSEEPHIEMSVIGGALCFPVACSSRPGLRQIKQTIPMNAINLAAQKFRGTLQSELLNLLRSEGRYSDLGDPHGQRGDALNFADLVR